MHHSLEVFPDGIESRERVLSEDVHRISHLSLTKDRICLIFDAYMLLLEIPFPNSRYLSALPPWPYTLGQEYLPVIHRLRPSASP